MVYLLSLSDDKSAGVEQTVMPIKNVRRRHYIKVCGTDGGKDSGKNFFGCGKKCGKTAVKRFSSGQNFSVDTNKTAL